jgi:ABC-type polysaccharide/polyol phosphate transport system ATPase subunit
MTVSTSEEASSPSRQADVIPAVRFEAVSKRFALQHEKTRSFQELWVRLLTRRRSADWEEFWALRDVTFDVQRGEMLGIVGRNGSGKSTLLRLAARTLRPTSGEVALMGRVAPLLELGAGFHPDMTGQDNIYLNASLFGLSRAYVAERYDDIVAFAELEQFIDTPMKHYSSGMWLRLGFAVAAHADADIMLIDETLSVGDAEFQQKCLTKIDEFRQAGKTILIVSHDLGQVAQMCDRVLWMEHGRLRAIGEASQIVDEYVIAAAHHSF